MFMRKGFTLEPELQSKKERKLSENALFESSKKKKTRHTKKQLLSVVRQYNLHHAIHNYAKLKKDALFNKILEYLDYDEVNDTFKEKSK